MTQNDDNLGFFKKSATAGIPYFHIFDNSICQKSKVELDGWEGPIKTQHPKTKAEVRTWVIRYDSIAAHIVDVNRFKKEFTQEQGGGKTSGMELTLQAGSMRAILTLKWGSNGPDPVLKRFLKVAPNVDFSKPLLISAFENKNGKQAVSFRQGDDPDPLKWEKVEEYWRRPFDPVTKKADMSVDATGADGSILPEPEHDDFNDSWSYDVQNKFLMQYFMEKIEPRIKANAPAKDTPRDNFPTGQQEEKPTLAQIPVQTTKPDVVVASSLQDTATGEQRAKIRQLSTAANFDFEAKCKDVMGCDFDELNIAGASFAIYKLETLIAQAGKSAPAQEPVKEMAVAAPAPVVVPEAPTELDDDWGLASAPADANKAPWDD